VRILTKKGKIIRATAAHFQEKHTHPPKEAKHQCLNPIDEDDEDIVGLPFHTAWFNEDGTDEIRHEAIQEMKTSRRSAHLQAQEHEPLQESIQHREHKPSEESIRHRDIHNQTTIASLVYNTISHTFTLLSSMLSNEPYEPKNWKLAMSHERRDLWLQAAYEEVDSLLYNKT
jgi:hypothetical protein